MTDRYTFNDLKNQYNFQRAERLAYIDFRLRFMGVINRSDLSDLFGIADAAASKEITEYRALRPDNVIYDRVLRANTIVRETFEPLMNINVETALGMLANGFNKNKLVDNPLMPYQRVGQFPQQLDEDIVSKITRAINCQTAICCNYVSGARSNLDERILLPTAIFYDGRSWKCRAYHRKTNTEESMFKCFNFSRFLNVEERPYDIAKLHETIERDRDWQLIVPIHLSVHPFADEHMQMGIRRDFGMREEQSELVITERAALVYFLIFNWGVDVSEDPIEEPRFSFHLKNAESLKHINSIKNIFK